MLTYRVVQMRQWRAEPRYGYDVLRGKLQSSPMPWMQGREPVGGQGSGKPGGDCGTWILWRVGGMEIIPLELVGEGRKARLENEEQVSNVL